MVKSLCSVTGAYIMPSEVTTKCKTVTYFCNENQNGSLNEELSNIKSTGLCFTPAGDFRCSQEQNKRGFLII